MNALGSRSAFRTPGSSSAPSILADAWSRRLRAKDLRFCQTRTYRLGLLLKLVVLSVCLAPWSNASAWWYLALLPPFDTLVLWQLVRYFPTKEEKLLVSYWLSPVVILSAYTQGSPALIAAALFFTGVSFVIRERIEVGGVCVAIAAFLQPELLIAIPLVLLFIYKKRFPPRRLANAAAGLLALGMIFALTAWAQAVRSVEHALVACGDVLARFPVQVSDDVTVYLGSAAVMGSLIKFSAFRKTNREILLLYAGVTCTLLVILAPPSPKLVLLAFPFFVYFFVGNSGLARLPFYALVVTSCAYAFVLYPAGAELLARVGRGDVTATVVTTLLIGTLVPAITLMLEVGVRRNEELRRSEEALLIGIAGDSASGKHTLLKIIEAVVGKQQSVAIFGDDFHRWERGDQRWQEHTHLDPTANRLHDGADVAASLRSGNPVDIVHYDHSTGKFTEPNRIMPRKFVFFVGLHPFYLARMRNALDIKIFIDVHESLRRARKVQRDVVKRGYTLEQVVGQIESRQDDFSQYIDPQKNYADLVIRYDPLEPIEHELDPNAGGAVVTSYRMSNSINLEALVTRLREIDSLSVQHFSSVEHQDLQVSGTLTLNEVVDIASELSFNFDELHIDPSDWVKRWIEGHNGISQLVFLHVYNNRMKAHLK